MTGIGYPERDTTQRIVDAYCARVADLLETEPERVLAKAERGLARMAPHCHSALVGRWRATLAMPPADLAAFLRSDSAEAREQRRNHPFAGLLPERERQDIVRRVWHAPP
jgi:hypothetical protein